MNMEHAKKKKRATENAITALRTTQVLPGRQHGGNAEVNSQCTGHLDNASFAKAFMVLESVYYSPPILMLMFLMRNFYN